MFNFIDRIGVEIEGGWDNDILDRETVHPDGSVSCPYARVIGEIKSKPYSDINELIEWVNINYPIFTHRSCGIHVHVSFKNEDYYAAITTQPFFSFFTDKMISWGERTNCHNKNFFIRLQGENSFCQKSFDPLNQLKNKGKSDYVSRYTQWNYCYKLHKTAECRLLPTFIQSKMAVSGIKKIANTVEEFVGNFNFQDEFNINHIETVKRIMHED